MAEPLRRRPFAYGMKIGITILSSVVVLMLGALVAAIWVIITSF